jgi:hypothetical protein
VQLAPVIARYSRHALAVRQLDAEFGIRSPSYIVSFEDTTALDDEDRPNVTAYVATNRIHGVYFTREHLAGLAHSYQLDQIPETVAVTAAERILAYFQAAFNDRVPHVWNDLRFGNLMYGRLQGDYEDDIYSFDLQDGDFYDVSTHGYHNIIGAADNSLVGLKEMTRAYGHNFAELKDACYKLRHDAHVKHGATQNDRLRKASQ